MRVALSTGRSNRVLPSELMIVGSAFAFVGSAETQAAKLTADPRCSSVGA